MKGIKKKFAVCLILVGSFFAARQVGAAETLQLLQDLIKIDTSNPPGNEIVAVRFVQKILQQEGIASEIIESVPGRGNLIARLKGNGTKPALILLGHLDVVPAEPTEWSFPPFDPQIRNGEIWGRGSLDMKSLVAMEIQTFIRLKKDNTPLAGDVLLILCADEESGGTMGADFLVKNHWDKIQAHYLLNEGGVGILKQGLHLYPIQVAEKGVVWMKLTAFGTAGHGSMPTEDNAIKKLSEALLKLTQYRFPIQRTKVTAAFLERLADHMPFPKNIGARYFFTPGLGSVVQTFAGKAISKDRSMRAMLSHTLSLTMVEAGYKINVIPSQATASIDARILPGETPEGFVKKVQQIVGEEFKIEMIQSSQPNESVFDTAYFKVIEEAVHRQDSQAITAPMMSAGATDSRFFREKGVISYGLMPLLITEEQLQGLHGKNERIPADQVERGTQTVYEIVKKMQGAL